MSISFIIELSLLYIVILLYQFAYFEERFNKTYDFKWWNFTIIGYPFLSGYLIDSYREFKSYLMKRSLKETDKEIVILAIAKKKTSWLNFNDASLNNDVLDEVTVSYRYVNDILPQHEMNVNLLGELAEKFITEKDNLIGSHCLETSLTLANLNSRMNAISRFGVDKVK